MLYYSQVLKHFNNIRILLDSMSNIKNDMQLIGHYITLSCRHDSLSGWKRMIRLVIMTMALEVNQQWESYADLRMYSPKDFNGELIYHDNDIMLIMKKESMQLLNRWILSNQC